MARLSDVVSSSRDTSPDPITLPSSPLGSRSPRKTRGGSIKQSPRKRVIRASATPSKSMVLDTPQAGNESPWRIKVTVEAEPRDGSPGKRISRTTTVPLKDSATKRSSSPIKRSASSLADGAEIRRPVRKRKGTPIRDKRPARPYVAPEPEPPTEEDDPMPPPSHTPARRASGRLARLSTYHNSTRSKRLSVAREELEYALQDAAGRSGSVARGNTPGDRTVSMNEDFSIISVDSLQTAKEASMTNVMQTIPELDRSTASINQPKSTSPKIEYPDIEQEVQSTKADSALAYDPMSWIPTGPTRRVSPQSFRHSGRRTISAEEQWQRERRDVIDQAESADANKVVVVDDAPDEEDDIDDPAEGVVGDDDLWQEEGSRSLHAEHEQINDEPDLENDHQQRDRSPQLEDLFAGQPLRPARSKIPRTWRRSSGMGFSYVDSPAHEAVAQQAEEQRHSTDGGSGVLTPPSTNADEEVEESESETGGEQDDADSEFQPDAEATRYHNDEEEEEDEDSVSPQSEGQDGDEPESPASEENSSQDDDDTGNFFSNNMPQVFLKERPRRRPPRPQKTMDLTELLNLDAANSPEKAVAPDDQSNSYQTKLKSSSQKKQSPLHMRAIERRVRNSPNDSQNSKLVSSPLRKSLLRSSKMQDSSHFEKDVSRSQSHLRPEAGPSRPRRRQAELTEDEIVDSFASKASDQRQLLQEASAQKPPPQQAYVQEDEDEDMQEQYDHDDNDHYEEQQDDQDAEEYEEETYEPLHSYEENLNKESPSKVRVNFNETKSSLLDSRTHSSLLDLTNRKNYPPLFGAPKQTRPDSPGTITLVDKKPPPQPGLLTRLSETFWSAVVRPSGPTSVFPQQQAQARSPPDPEFPPTLRAKLRSRYGVISDSFPWTMHHMRTLHRMLNSLTTNAANDTLIPSSGPLPSHLKSLINTYQTSTTSSRYFFAKAHAYVVWSFFQVLVPPSTIEAMQRGEVEWLGDSLARKCREYYGERHGSEPVWHGDEVAKWVDALKGRVGVGFVVGALGCCVESNEILEQERRMGRK